MQGLYLETHKCPSIDGKRLKIPVRTPFVMCETSRQNVLVYTLAYQVLFEQENITEYKKLTLLMIYSFVELDNSICVEDFHILVRQYWFSKIKYKKLKHTI